VTPASGSRTSGPVGAGAAGRSVTEVPTTGAGGPPGRDSAGAAFDTSRATIAPTSPATPPAIAPDLRRPVARRGGCGGSCAGYGDCGGYGEWYGVCGWYGACRWCGIGGGCGT
jgi:hypothetical protein